jgi:hypothetical protein
LAGIADRLKRHVIKDEALCAQDDAFKAAAALRRQEKILKVTVVRVQRRRLRFANRASVQIRRLHGASRRFPSGFAPRRLSNMHFMMHPLFGFCAMPRRRQKLMTRASEVIFKSM